jgi:hypothetical protein
MIRVLFALAVAAMIAGFLFGCTSYNREVSRMLADWQAALAADAAAAEEATP